MHARTQVTTGSRDAAWAGLQLQPGGLAARAPALLPAAGMQAGFPGALASAAGPLLHHAAARAPGQLAPPEADPIGREPSPTPIDMMPPNPNAGDLDSLLLDSPLGFAESLAAFDVPGQGQGQGQQYAAALAAQQHHAVLGAHSQHALGSQAGPGGLAALQALAGLPSSAPTPASLMPPGAPPQGTQSGGALPAGSAPASAPAPGSSAAAASAAAAQQSQPVAASQPPAPPGGSCAEHKHYGQQTHMLGAVRVVQYIKRWLMHCDAFEYSLEPKFGRQELPRPFP